VSHLGGCQEIDSDIELPIDSDDSSVEDLNEMDEKLEKQKR
jgi:hypothetical protein